MYSEKSKIVICLDSFPKQIYNILVDFRLISVFETTTLLNLPIYSISPRLLLPVLRILLLKHRYGPSCAYLMNIFFALKGSIFFYSFLLN